MAFEPGTYILVPKDFIGASPPSALGIGIIQPREPPPDAAVRIVGPHLIDRWVIKADKNNTFTVHTGRGRPDDFRWVVNDDDLFASVTKEAVGFRFESAGDDLWVIGLFGRDALLTADNHAVPQLSFKRADGSAAQRFRAIQIGPR